MWVLKPWHRAILVTAIAGIAISALAWFAWRDPEINYLPRDKRAEWIVFPAAVDAHAHWFSGLDAIFRREIVLTNPPATARLSVRAMRRAEVKINGTSIRFPPNSNWKRIMIADVADGLHPGTNVIEARVFNHNGPPAFWLTLTTDQLSLRSDETWDTSLAGSSWRHAALTKTAKTIGTGNSLAGGGQTLQAMKEYWPLWIALGAFACTAAFLWHTKMKQATATTRLLLLASACLWFFLFWNNTRLLPSHAGFDSVEHLKYISYIQEHRALPLPTEGLEMYQPPLYYLIGAVALSVCRLSVNDPASVVVLRLLGGFFGIIQFILIFLSLRLLLPVRAAWIGLLLAVFLPMHLYLAQYVTNEMLAATLATASVYLCLRLLKNETPRTLEFACLGLPLGAAMLAKVTTILLLPVVLAAVTGRLAYTRVPIPISLRNLGLLLAICFAVCGWYYARIWLRFGTPMVGNWDVTSGFIWWQEPGYHMAGDYLRFGHSLVHPFFSGFAGFADGIYSTLWGDGLCGGSASLTLAWNQQPMVAGYLWALIPTVLILTGAVVGTTQFIRKPSSELFLLLGFSAAMVFGLIFMTLRVPSYAQAKAFYGLSALLPLCFFGSLGWETLTQKRAPLQFVFGVFVLIWAMNSFAAYWIVPSVSQRLYVTKALGASGQIDRAAAESLKAVQTDPSNAPAREFHALSLNQLGLDEEAVQEAVQAVQLQPDDSASHLDLAICVKRNNEELAIAEARRAIELGPENSSAYQFLMNCLFDSRRYNDAAELGRQWLAVAPYDAAAHSALGAALAESGDDPVSAAEQLGYVMMLRPEVEQAHAQLRQLLMLLAKEPNGLQRLREIAANAPDSPRMLDELAWLLATYPDSMSRDGTEAVRLAEHACDLTERKVPALLDTLAAAYAESGDFTRAISAAEEALNRAQTVGDSDASKLTENILASLRENLPYRQPPE